MDLIFNIIQTKHRKQIAGREIRQRLVFPTLTFSKQIIQEKYFYTPTWINWSTTKSVKKFVRKLKVRYIFTTKMTRIAIFTGLTLVAANSSMEFVNRELAKLIQENEKNLNQKEVERKFRKESFWVLSPRDANFGKIMVTWIFRFRRWCRNFWPNLERNRILTFRV